MANTINAYSNIIDQYNSLIKTEESASDSSSLASGSFEDLLYSQITKLNDKQVQADGLIQDFAAGNVDDLHQVMIASEEAMLSMELAVQIRNKVVEAYKELNNMQL